MPSRKAIALKEKHGGEVTVVTFGEEEAEKELRTALAMGADKAVLIDSEEIEEGDQFSTATILATYLKDQRCRYYLSRKCSGRWGFWSSRAKCS